MNTPIIMSANAMIDRMFSEASIYCPSHPPTADANSYDTHIPAISDTIDITWLMKPFLIPLIKAGMKQIKRMISRMLIISSKIYIFAV